MEQYVIKGGNPLVGEVVIGGAKNAALGILAAAIMTDDQCLIDNVPDVRDTNVLLQAMELNFPEDSKRGEGYQRIEVKGPTAEQKIVWDAYIDPVIMFAKDFPENIFLKNIQFGGE